MVETIIKWSLKDIFKADATKCYEEIQEIGEEVKPEQVIERAKDKGSELHKCFDWNNSVAADKWRLHQARSVLNHLIVIKHEVDDEKSEPVQFRVMMKNNRSESSGYKQTIVMVKDEDEYKKLLEQAYSELRAFKQKYQCLSELSEILALID